MSKNRDNYTINMRAVKVKVELIEYADGEKLLGEAYNSGSDYILCGPINWLNKVCSPMPEVKFVVDNTTSLIGVFTGPGSDVVKAVYTIMTMVPCAWIVLIPRSTDPKLMSEVGLNQAVLENKYVIMASHGEELRWPNMFVNGISIFDPISAADIRRQTIR